jgi:dipeptidyl aminopeptidase/acylaminoacyl peptidase
MTDADSTADASDRPAAERDDVLEALATLPSFYHPTASPDGDEVAYYHDESGRNELYVQDVASGDRVQLSDANVPENARMPFVWDADGDRLYLHRDDDGDEQHDLHAIARDGTTELVAENDGQTFLQDVARDGSWFVYATTATGQMNLHRYDVDAGESTQLTAHDEPAMQARISPDGDWVAYQSNERDHPENRDVYLVRADDGDTERFDGGDPDRLEDSDPERLDVGDLGTETTPASWHPDGDRLLVGDDAADRNRAGLYHVDSGDVTWYGPGEYEEVPQYVLPDGDRLLALRTRGCEEIPVVYDVDDPDSGRELDLPDGTASIPDGPHRNGVLADGRVLLTHQSPTTREHVLAYDLETDATETLLDADYGDVDPDDFADCDLVTYESTDGLEIEALCYDSGERPSPAIVLVHGGPHFAEGKTFNAQFQFLVDRGYSLLVPNYRGSTGRGREFKNAIHRDWGGMEQEDIAQAGRWLKRQNWVDADRVAVFGGSYGGYSTYMQLVQRPGFWSAGVAFVGMTDLHALYEESMPHFKTGLERQLGDPDEREAFYRERSAITHVDDIEDPLLMVHGVNDPRCPISQARSFRDALLERGWEVGEQFEYEELGDEGHTSTDTDHKRTTLRLLADFFDDRL